jgi:hypothetical protein
LVIGADEQGPGDSRRVVADTGIALHPARRREQRTWVIAAVAALVAALGLAAAWWVTPTTTSGTAARPESTTPAHPFGFVDTPQSAALIGPNVSLAGWALAHKGIDRVEVRLDGEVFLARHGLPRPDVATVHPSLSDAGRAGFAFHGDFTGRLSGRHTLSVDAVDRDGVSREIARKAVLAPEPFARWKPLLDARPDLATAPFYLLPATSGVQVKGADEIRETYAGYESSTMRAGVRIPILYMRTTKGRAADWIFDPDWDIDRRCGERRIADDSLASVIAYVVANRLPVLFTLNGGLWADASCDVPDWDLNDELERDARNCQWTARNAVPVDHALRDRTGSQASPEIGRALTLNAYADKVRTYKRRNLQAAARIIHQFASRHPDLFVGVSLDPDVYILPWYAGEEWFDFNPDTIRQFRDWLRGTGPYAVGDAGGTRGLSAYRRAKPLTLTQVNAVARRDFATWDEVDPPRTFPPQGDLRYQAEWNEPWRLLWDQFRRHLVQVHYTELAAWVIETGISADKVFTSQAFTAPDPGYLPQPIRVDGPTTDYDSGGVSVEGAIPRQGRLGVILYGDSARNDSRTQTGEPQFRIFERMSSEWAVVEFSTANLKKLSYLPTYADAYQAFREITNFRGKMVSPMAWNGSNGNFAGQPGYQTFTSWRNTPAEEAAFDLMVERANLPARAKLWTFGSPRHQDTDGWTMHGAGTLVANKGYVEIPGGSRDATVHSPPFQYIRADRYDLVVFGVADPSAIESVSVAGRIDGTSRWIPLANKVQAATLKRTPAGLSIPLRWARSRIAVDQLRIDISRTNEAAPIRIDHIALYPRGQAGSR